MKRILLLNNNNNDNNDNNNALLIIECCLRSREKNNRSTFWEHKHIYIPGEGKVSNWVGKVVCINLPKRMIFHLTISWYLMKGRHKIDESETCIMRDVLLQNKRLFGLLWTILLSRNTIQVHCTICHQEKLKLLKTCIDMVIK